MSVTALSCRHGMKVAGPGRAPANNPSGAFHQPTLADAVRPLYRRRFKLIPSRPTVSRHMADADTLPKETAETHSFQAEVAELLRLMVHSVYSETDVFLRELISNASDACDRLRYEAIAKPELTADGAPFTIRIKPDSAAATLTIADNGIGMDRRGVDWQSRHRRPLRHPRLHEQARRGERRRKPDRPVRRRILFGFHGGGAHRGGEPPRGIARGLDLGFFRRRRL